MQRRQFVKSSVSLTAGLGLQAMLPAWAQSASVNGLYSNTILNGLEYDLSISEVSRQVAGRVAKQIVVNGQLPAPLLRWKEGDNITLRVNNELDVASSIHWHGVLVPPEMDGVPGLSFSGIGAGESFKYQFSLKQSGTYWYHSHSGLQEQLGHYGPIIIDPIEEDPIAYDREYVLVLSDWSFEDPHRIFSKLKKMSATYNFQRRTVADFFKDAREQGMSAAIEDRAMWGAMRMSPADLSDVTGATYSYLLNGHSIVENWTALFQPGEKIRLRFINASAMTTFNIRIPGLPLTVVQADGLNVQPVEVDEFQIGIAETFDVLVNPQADGAFSIYCENTDRSGYARATLASREGMSASVPAMRPRPLLTMKDMGMDMNMPMQNEINMSGAGTVHDHAIGPGVTNVAMNPVSRLHERPLGLENEAHRVLVYTDLRSLDPNPDQRPPQRELELHLTGNMERYMWSFDGLKFSEVSEPVKFRLGERLRLTLVNDTMMLHPIHLHGMYFDVVTGDHTHKPRKHTIVLKPGEKLSVDITPDVVGEWAFHCHLLYHMHAGMMRVVSVNDKEGVA